MEEVAVLRVFREVLKIVARGTNSKIPGHHVLVPEKPGTFG